MKSVGTSESYIGRICLIVGLVLFAIWAVSDPAKYVVGTDLSGGTILEYKLKIDPQRPVPFKMEELTEALKRRLDPEGIKSYVIRGVGSDGVEIIMPRSDEKDVDDVKRRISTVGQLKFRIVADKKRHSAEMGMAARQWPRRQIGVGDQVLAEFIPFARWIPTIEPADIEKGKAHDWSKTPKAFDVEKGKLRFVPLKIASEYKESEKNQYLEHDVDGLRYVLCSFSLEDDSVSQNDNLVKYDEYDVPYVLLFNDKYNAVGDDLSFVDKDVDPKTHKPCVAFTFNLTGSEKFGGLTEEFSPDRDGKSYKLAVVLDNVLRSAPFINSKITDRGIITVSRPEDVAPLVSILKAGKLPVGVEREPERQHQIKPTLGEDTIRSGKISVVLALVGIGAFMIWYYRFAGVVSVFALVMNILFTVALMVAFKATWTLPGLAGLVLTVGMSVDANVLVFERIREEMDRGASLPTAIRLGYERAWLPILDSNTTSVITAIILYTIGTDQVKGFAITLVLGILTGLFTSLYFTRVVFDVLYSRKMLKGFHFRRFFEHPNFDFLALRKKAFTFSLVLIAIGMVAFIARWDRNFDVDFTGGTKAGMQFTKPLTTAEVRDLAIKADVKDVSVEQVDLSNIERNTYFVVRTTEKETPETKDAIKKKLSAGFKEYLPVVATTLSDVKKVEAPKAEPGKPAPAEDPFLSGFKGGSEGVLKLSRPHPESWLRSKFDDLVHDENAETPDSKGQVALAPVGEGSLVGTSTALSYSEFRIATSRQDLKGTIDKLNQRLSQQPDFAEFSQFGPQAASSMQLWAIVAVALSWISIIAVLGYRFSSLSFGLGGVAALVHDVLMSLGLVAIFSTLGAAIPALQYVFITEMKINLDMVAAVLTLIGYSIHDTIVTFDRIREIRARGTRVTAEIINRGVNETLSRTIITSTLTWFSVVVLFFGGGAALRGFAFLLVVGLLSGTYSTIFISNPVLLYMAELQDRRSKGKAAPKKDVPAKTA